MKKILTLVLLCSFIFAAFADDAKVMPAGVIRGTFAFTNTTADEAYDADGEAQDLTVGGSLSGALSAMNFGSAIEMGITDQVTAAVQWAPGYTFSGGFDTQDKIDIKSMNELFVGAKIQAFGENGFVSNDKVRFSIAPGILIPTDSLDVEESYDNIIAGKDYRADAGKEAFGLGGRIYADYVIMPGFFINFYSEFISFLPVDKKNLANYYDLVVAKAMLAGQPQANAAAYATSLGATNEDVEFKYGYDLTLEVEPQYTYSLGDVGSVSVGLPFTYSMAPEVEIDGVGQDDASNLLQVKPWVSFFTTKTGLPMSFAVQYYAPLLGENSKATSTLVLKAKIYARVF